MHAVIRWICADNLPYEKVGKNEPVCIADKVPFDIPDTWEWVRLGSIGETNIGLTYKPIDKVDEKSGTAVLRSNNIQKGKMDYSDMVYVSCNVPERAMIAKGDILICARNGSRALVGKSAIVDMDGMAFGAFMAKYTSLLSGILNPYILTFIESPVFREQLDGVKTETINQITQDMIKEQLIPIPPLAEQLRINEKLEELMPYIEKYGVAYLEVTKLNGTFPDMLKKSILQEAVQGKLVPQDPTDEPASVLLERIRAEKEQLIKSGKIKRDKHESVIFRRDNSHYEKCGSEEVCIDDYLPFELPDNWQWERLINLYNFIDYRGSTPTKIESGVPLITAKNVKKGYIDYRIRDYISEEEYGARQSRGISQRGDILFTTEAPLGNVALADLEQFSAGQRLITLQQYTEYPLINNNLVMYFMLSDCFQSQLVEQSTGTTVKGIKADKLKQLWIPVPPLQEQARILELLKKVLESCVAL